MKKGVVSVLSFPFNNKLEVRVSRAERFNTRELTVNVYSAPYTDKRRAYRLAKLAGKLNGLVLIKMIDSNVQYGSALV